MNPSDEFSNIPLPAHPEKCEIGHKLFENEDGVPQPLIDAVFGNSPYLAKLISLDPAYLAMACKEGFDTSFEKLISEMKAYDVSTASKKDLMKRLRQFKNRASLLIALADICNKWNLSQVTNALSDFADIALQLTVSYLLHERHQQKLLTSPAPENSGFIVLAVGKLGGGELNYSSDIDLIVLYDSERVNYIGKLSAKEFFIRVTQELVEIMSARTGDGYVFRTDLRLRPDPYSTPLAVSTQAAEVYYENVGQNWERAAMIKARFVAGDGEAAKKYLHFLDAYIWRKYLDFNALEDIHSIKRQIDARTDYKPGELLKYNIKTGKGGIREIEFFVQTQQLIWGGRENSLRSKTTCDGLRMLAETGHISAETAEQLVAIYESYRRIEHRLQMQNDEHTHTLPDNETAFADFATFLGYADVQSFKNELTLNLAVVQKHYAKLFIESPSLSTGGGNLVFTGVTSDPETMLNISKMGFRDAEKICEIIRGWHHGRRRATRFRRVREILTELIPHILKSFGDSSNPDEAMAKFDNFLGQIPSGVQLFTLFADKPALIDLLAEIMGNSPWLAQNLSRSPALVNRVLTTDFAQKFPRIWDLRQSLAKAVDFGADYEEKMKIIRRWKHDKEFQVGIRLLKGIATHEYSAWNLSDIAEVVIEAVFALVQAQEEKIEGEIAVVAMGKLGVRELTFGSDLDLVFVYDSDAAEATTYYTRIITRFITAISALSRDGNLYNVDTRLRPLGEKGQLAVAVETYAKYYHESAWIWELMALTKARVVCGPEKLTHELQNIIAKNLTRQFDKATLITDLSKMREKTAGSYSDKNIWDVKYVRGGIFDMEFIYGYHILAEGHNFPEVIKANFEDKNIAVILASKGIISSKAADELSSSFMFLRNVQSAVRLTTQGRFDESQASENQKQMLTHSLGETKFESLKTKLAETEKLVYQYYSQIFQKTG